MIESSWMMVAIIEFGILAVLAGFKIKEKQMQRKREKE